MNHDQPLTTLVVVPQGWLFFFVILVRLSAGRGSKIDVKNLQQPMKMVLQVESWLQPWHFIHSEDDKCCLCKLRHCILHAPASFIGVLINSVAMKFQGGLG